MASDDDLYGWCQAVYVHGHLFVLFVDVPAGVDGRVESFTL